MRVAMLSAGGAMAEAALVRMIELGRAPTALLLHQGGASGRLPVMPQSPLAQIAYENRVAVLTSSTDDLLLEQCRSITPDVVLSVCFPRRIPASVARVARLGAVNAHSSSLPAWRGPDPVFWQLRHGVQSIGVTLHGIVEQIDSGPVFRKSRVDLRAVSSELEIDRAVGVASASMLVDWIDGGASIEAAADADCASGRWWRQPRDEDYRIFPAWDCAHAVRFMRILAERKVPYRWSASGADLLLSGPAESGSSGDVEIELGNGRLSCWRLEPAEQR